MDSFSPAAVLLLAIIGLIQLAGLIWLIKAIRAGSPALPRVARVVGLIVICLAVLQLLFGTFEILFGDSPPVTIHVTPFIPHAAEGFTVGPTTAQIISGGPDTATAMIQGLSLGTRLLLVASLILQYCTVIGVAVVVVRLSTSLREGDAFRIGSRALLSCALIVIIGGLAWSILGDLGSWQAGQEALTTNGWSANFDVPDTEEWGPTLSQYGWPEPAAFSLSIPLWPLGAGLVLSLLAAVFRTGEKLRQDAEGLV